MCYGGRECYFLDTVATLEGVSADILQLGAIFKIDFCRRDRGRNKKIESTVIDAYEILVQCDIFQGKASCECGFTDFTDSVGNDNVFQNLRIFISVFNGFILCERVVECGTADHFNAFAGEVKSRGMHGTFDQYTVTYDQIIVGSILIPTGIIERTEINGFHGRGNCYGGKSGAIVESKNADSANALGDFNGAKHGTACKSIITDRIQFGYAVKGKRFQRTTL